MSQLLFNVEAERYGTFCLLTELGVAAAEGNQLFTDGTAPDFTIYDGFPLALPGVAEHPLHLVTAVQAAVGVPALTRVLQALDAALDAHRPSLLRIADGW